MSQLALDLRAVAPPSLDNFVAGSNLECAVLMRRLAQGERSQRFVYLWGLPGSGRSHLLKAISATGRLLGPQSPVHAFAFDASCTLYAADDVHAMDAGRQHALFHLFNQVQAAPDAALVTSGDHPPLRLPVREDLRTRLGWGLVFELQLLSDDEKAEALRKVAAERGVVFSPEIVPWLLTHRSRDIRALLEQFDALDRFAFERKRPITLPLVREWLQHDFGQPFGASARD